MIKRWFFFFFLLSGFCSLIYQVVWLRLAMASYGVTTPLISIVLSVFMAGLAAGSWVAGRLSRVPGSKTPTCSSIICVSGTNYWHFSLRCTKRVVSRTFFNSGRRRCHMGFSWTLFDRGRLGHSYDVALYHLHGGNNTISDVCVATV